MRENIEDAIEILTNMFIKEHIENNEEMLSISKEELIKFCIKLLKTIQKN